MVHGQQNMKLEFLILGYMKADVMFAAGWTGEVKDFGSRQRKLVTLLSKSFRWAV
jgi:hypothetical protein